MVIEDRVLTTPPRTATRTPPAWAVVLAASVGQFLVVLDISVVNVALPSIRSGLDLGVGGLQWVVNAYSLTFAGFLLLGGRAADLFGRKRVFVAGLGVFAAASLVGGLASDGWVLVTGRALQGFGAAILAPVTLSLLTSTFPDGPARTKAIAAWTAVGTAGGAVGGLVGGLLTEYVSWRWVLLVNVPVGIVVTLVAARWLRNEREDRRPRLDVPGALLVTAGVALLDFGIGQTQAHGWFALRSLGPLVVGLVALAAFVAVEARTAEPLVPLQLFRRRSVAVGNLATLVATSGGFALWYLLSLYMQNVLRYGPVRTGLAFLPHTLGVIAGSRLAPTVMSRVGARPAAAIGGLLAAGGFAWQSAVLPDGTFVGAILGPGFTMCLGFGLLMTPLVDAATAGVAANTAGAVAGIVNTSRTIGGAVGLTVLATTAAAGAGAGPGGGYAAAFRLAAAVTVAGTALVALLPRGRRHGR